MLVLCLVEARFPAGDARDLPGAARAAPGRGGLGASAVIVEADGWTVYDALADPAAGRELLHRMRSNREFQVGQDEFIFRWAPNAGAAPASAGRSTCARSASSSPTPRSSSATS